MRERDNEAWVYLTQERGLRPFWIKQFQLGWVREPANGHARYKDRISIPYLNGLGQYRGLRFRRLDDGKPKYDGDPGVQSHLFAPKYAAEKLVYIVEGEFDCIILHQLGVAKSKEGRGAVGIPGANHFKREWRWTFRNAEHVIGVLDGDGNPQAAGTFKTKIHQHLHDLVPVISFIQMPNGYDVNSMYKKDRRKLARLLEVK